MAFPQVFETGPISVVAPAAIQVGEVLTAGQLVGVALTDAAAGGDVTISIRGICELPLKSGDNPTLGAKMYWNSTNKYLTVTKGSNTLVGCCVLAGTGRFYLTPYKHNDT